MPIYSIFERKFLKSNNDMLQKFLVHREEKITIIFINENTGTIIQKKRNKIKRSVLVVEISECFKKCQLIDKWWRRI